MFFLETHQSHGWRGSDMFHENITLNSTGLADIENRELIPRWTGGWTGPENTLGSLACFFKVRVINARSLASVWHET